MEGTMKNTLIAILLATLSFVSHPCVAEDKLAEVTDMQALQKAVQNRETGIPSIS